jgi:hypothetical protein
MSFALGNIIRRSFSFSSNLYANIDNNNNLNINIFKNLLNKKSNLFNAKDNNNNNNKNNKNKNKNKNKNNQQLNLNLNGCFPIIKKTEIKNKDIFNYYEFNDDNGKNIIIKSKVIYSNSPDFNINKNSNSNNNSEMNKDIIEKEIINIDAKSKLNDLNNFKWDNINEYFAKQERLKIKEKIISENKINKDEVISIYSILLSKIKERIYQRFEKFQLKKVFFILLLGFIIQLIVSKK